MSDKSEKNQQSGLGADNDKPTAIFVTSLFAVPAVLLCCLGPVILFALLSGAATGLTGWLAGLDIGSVALAVAGGALAVAWLMRRRAVRRKSPRNSIKEQT